MYLEFVPLPIGETYSRLQCQWSASLSIFVSSDVILSTLFHSSRSVPTSCCFCIPHACVHFFSSMLLASVHHPDFMAHDVSASRNLESELPLGISPPGLFGAFDWLHRRHRVHRAGVLIAFCTRVPLVGPSSGRGSPWWDPRPAVEAVRGRYRCSFVLTRQGNLSISSTSFIRLLPPPDNCGLLPNPKKTYDFNTVQ